MNKIIWLNYLLSTQLFILFCLFDFQTREDLGLMDSQLERKVDMIRNMVESYLNIVHKTQRILFRRQSCIWLSMRWECGWLGASLQKYEGCGVRGRAESERPDAHISFFTCLLMKWCFGYDTPSQRQQGHALNNSFFAWRKIAPNSQG